MIRSIAQGSLSILRDLYRGAIVALLRLDVILIGDSISAASEPGYFIADDTLLGPFYIFVYYTITKYSGNPNIRSIELV